jgi:hypothetical protein
MLRFIYCLILLGSMILENNAKAEDLATNHNSPPLDARNGWQHILGTTTTNELQPDIVLGYSGAGWDVEIDLIAQADIPDHTWLAISNRVGSRLKLWQTNGTPVISTNASALAAFHLPKLTTVSEARRGVYRERRGGQWLGGRNPVHDGTSLAYTSVWSLQSVFDMSLTNDYVLQITPLIYKVETNEMTAHLVEFPPVKVKLMANGNVQKLSD